MTKTELFDLYETLGSLYELEDDAEDEVALKILREFIENEIRKSHGMALITSELSNELPAEDFYIESPSDKYLDYLSQVDTGDESDSPIDRDAILKYNRRK
jgi:hypothetical protein